MTAIEPSGLFVSAGHAIVKRDHIALADVAAEQCRRRMALVFGHFGDLARCPYVCSSPLNSNANDSSRGNFVALLRL
jgi:hypothetical protein